ncbi:hypothetical protein HanIR_Chr15g0736281 [Helianthus annuus]|nr:hypothetical protein HanIR_Chr15g0736281 [Helianthus annuus]
MQTIMNRSHRQSAPHKRQGRDEEFDFLIPSPRIIKPSSNIRSSPKIRPPPKIIKRTQKPIHSQAMATTSSPKEGVPQAMVKTKSPEASSSQVATTNESPKAAAPPPGFSSHQAITHKGPETKEDPNMLEDQVEELRYREVSELLKSGEVHIPGIINPSQLAQFLKLKPKN